MSYRDDHAAARARLDVVEAELGHARRELTALRQRRAPRDYWTRVGVAVLAIAAFPLALLLAAGLP